MNGHAINNNLKIVSQFQCRAMTAAVTIRH
jgi:hypothetical protein